MINKKKDLSLCIFMVISIVSIGVLSFVNLLKEEKIFAQNNEYQLSLNRSINSDEISLGNASYLTSNQNLISFSFDSYKVEVNPNGIINLLDDGCFYNETPILGIKNISITFSNGSMKLTYGNYIHNLILGSETLNTNGNNDVVFDVDLNSPSNYFKLDNVNGPSLIKEVTITYSCKNEITPTSKLKTAVFADVQLSAKENGTGYYANAGNTVHAYVALKNHLELCKEQDVDVILMNGDIVNNAIETYYNLFEEALQSVYGNNESLYPEIIYGMGNHEWWDITEHETENAVALYKEHARINTPSLVRESSVRYYLDNNETVPTYYKVVKGVPFLVVSGEDSSGKISNEMKAELASWLEEISNLQSVRDGGAIYVLYHYPLNVTLTHGNGAGIYASVLEELLEDYPQAVVFTGDTHYSGVNERAINQVDFTTINIGSSSYSRMDKMSATMTGDEHFYNMKIKGGKTSDELVGDSNYKHEYTPTIHIMNTMDDESTTINRYFSTDDEEHPIHINNEWRLPSNITKSAFEYTDERFENAAYAHSLYGANGVSWPDNAELRFGINNDKMTVIVPDTNEYHYTEHYQIEVIGNSSKTYDVVTNYYTYNSERGELYFFLEDLPSGTNYTVRVTAYDYFDNPSLNYLTSNVNDLTVYADEKDNQFTNTYSELSCHLNYEEHTLNGNTSLEYYYNGVKRNEYGAPLGQLIRDVVPGKTNGGENISSYLSIGSTERCEVILRTKVKNLTNTPLKLGYTLYGANYVYKNAEVTNTGKMVEANSNWTSLEWNITDQFPDVIGRSGVTFLALLVSANGYGYNSNGYEMHLLIDDMDVIAGDHIDILEEATRNNIEMCDCLRDDNKCGYDEVSYNETYGLESTSSRKFTFSDSTGFGNSDSSTWRAFTTFDLATSLGENNGIDPKNCTLSFDVKFSSEIINSPDTRALTQFTLETNSYPSVAYLNLSSPDGNGWIHVEINLNNVSGVTPSDNMSKLRLGFYGIYSGNKSSAFIIIDNLALVTNS